MKKLKLIFPLFVMFALVFTACGESESDEPMPSGQTLSIKMPASVDVTLGGDVTFQLNSPFTFGSSDSFVFENTAGVSHPCAIIGSDNSSVTVRLSKNVVKGNYKVYCNHGGRKIPCGTTFINIVEGLDFEPDASTTVYGVVSDGDGNPVQGVVISDGVEVATTDARGIYQLASAKYFGYVFMSTPSGYDAQTIGVMPDFTKYTHGVANEVERIDFKVKRNPTQDTYKLLVMGDMHLANRTSDLKQFAVFANEVSAYAASNPNTYALTLGDMTWDIYWTSNKFDLSDYVSTMNEQVSGMQVYHTMGNHDNEYTATSDFEAEIPYRNILAPTYYSFNIGQVHYVVLDNIDCSNYNGTDDRNYTKSVTDMQFAWLRKDLAHVDKSTPVIVSMHAQMFYPKKNSQMFNLETQMSKSSNELFSIFEGRSVHFVTGHTHLMYNVTPETPTSASVKVYEHNAGAVCGSWWWGGHLTDGVNLSPDGTPSGYGIWEINGKDIKYRYKSTGKPIDHQFRAYDLNQLDFTMADVPNFNANAPTNVKNSLNTYLNAYNGEQKNEVLINVWNYNPSWTITVTTESGQQLNVTPTWAYDPLHIASMTLKRFDSSSIKSIPNFITDYCTHFFKVTAPDADSDLTITVTDDFGNTSTQKMVRPMAFSIGAYK